jgi:hypothetical protein
MSKITQPFERPVGREFEVRLQDSHRLIQVVEGARQVGKTTMVHQVLGRTNMPHVFVTADEPATKDATWIAAQWERARLAERGDGAILVLDEIQKIPTWSDAVKRLWDEDSRTGARLKVALLGSATLLIQQGLTESLTGRFEILHVPHWSYSEMRDAFGFSVDDYVFFGGYPGAAPLRDDESRWRRYLLDSLIDTTIARDVLLMTRVDKPALLRRVFELACRYSGQVLSFTKMLGQLQDAGNVTTLAHYLELLAGAGMVTGLQKYSGTAVRLRGSSPKLQVLNTALMTALSGLSREEARDDREYRGRLVESVVGAHLANAAAGGECELFYWRERGHEVDFVIRAGRSVTAIEVKSGRAPTAFPGLSAFAAAFTPKRTLIVGADGIPLEEFLVRPATHWL